MLKLILDVGVGNRVAKMLQAEGFDVVSILDVNPSMSDADILSIAESDERMVITMDKDFGELVFLSGKRHNGVLLLRLEDADGKEKEIIVQSIFRQFVEQMEGRFCVFQNGRLRIR